MKEGESVGFRLNGSLLVWLACLVFDIFQRPVPWNEVILLTIVVLYSTGILSRDFELRRVPTSGQEKP